jgi:endonuclease-8
VPEGPEIRRAADRLADILEGRQVESAKFGLPRLRRHGKTLSGHRVERLETRGKALLTHFEHGWTVYSHNQLYGVWKIAKRGKLPRTNRSLRLALHTADHSALLYSASDISVWRTEEVEEHPFLKRIGPDILSPELEWRRIAAQLDDDRFRRRSLAALYLDQAFIAGIGNYLRAEILFAAGLHPDRRPADLSRGEIGRLARSTLAVSQRSYATGGIVTAPRLLSKLKKLGLPREKTRFYVFGRQGLPCYRCSGEVKRIESNSRRLYLCPTCQPPGN